MGAKVGELVEWARQVTQYGPREWSLDWNGRVFVIWLKEPTQALRQKSKRRRATGPTIDSTIRNALEKWEIEERDVS